MTEHDSRRAAALTDLLKAEYEAGAKAGREQATRKAAAPPSQRAGLLTTAEVAEELRCSTRTVKRLIACGRLPTVQLSLGGSSRVLVRRAALDHLIDECSSDYFSRRKLRRV